MKLNAVFIVGLTTLAVAMGVPLPLHYPQTSQAWTNLRQSGTQFLHSLGRLPVALAHDSSNAFRAKQRSSQAAWQARERRINIAVQNKKQAVRNEVHQFTNNAATSLDRISEYLRAKAAPLSHAQ
ncbi:hypothetical protein H4R33_001084 [Dimargaris cristalligena]|uniref:Uncharacterized protein n=1 Tax=Dimargaris cristalligena TaxID=215637 RepID=A0A4P9ZY80_9FUNG|nr:hypothetical protein H4R33_001084 [Dimargaris cristalligena]RKP38328.1 hypothetical protein BJ085DRAFT_36675 [Dimargaris cristalligena]|eukprot:RKP38328.1 hypothetical protein BJ085DRAFT_36675 [Dimargaris cristalligena]